MSAKKWVVAKVVEMAIKKDDRKEPLMESN